MGAAYTDEFTEDIIEDMITALECGQSMKEICDDPRMPAVNTFWRWAKADDELGKRIMRARECGYFYKADAMVEAVKLATDPAKARLEFDAERWRLSKLANAFADKVKHVGGGIEDDPIHHRHDIALEAADEFTRGITSLAARAAGINGEADDGGESGT